MNELLIFVSQQWLLITVLFSLFAGLIYYESLKAGKTITPVQLIGMINQQQCSVLDLRPQEEFSNGHITGSKNIPHNQVNDHIHNLKDMTDRPLVLVCSAGQHSGATGKKLRALGLEKIFRLGGGISEWQRQQLPLVKK